MRDLATDTGRSIRTVTGWIQRGLPCRTVDGERRVVRADALAWLLAEAREAGRASVATLDEAAERTAYMKARRELAELELAEARGELARRETVVAAWRQMCERILARQRALPAKAAPVLVGLKKPAEAQVILERYIEEIVGEIREWGSADEGKGR